MNTMYIMCMKYLLKLNLSNIFFDYITAIKTKGNKIISLLTYEQI